MKTSNNRFARLIEEYNEFNREIHRVETRVEPTSEDVEEELKRPRVRLKDEIAQMLAGAEKTAGEAPPRDRERVDAPRMRGGMEAHPRPRERSSQPAHAPSLAWFSHAGWEWFEPRV